MEQLINEVSKLALMKTGQVYPIIQKDDVTYLHKSTSGFAVAIPFNDERNFDESFVGISLSTDMLNYDGNSIKVLYLNMLDTGDLKKFSYIGAEFIDIENRQSIINNPYAWVDTWKEMFGDAKKKFLITDVVAELAVLKSVYISDKTASWQGPKSGTHDIVTEKGVIEVKSTTHKTNNYVSINSAFQINPDINEKLYFVRLEPKPYATSIDTLVNDLTVLGYNSNELEDCLKEMGYKKGNRTRKITYSILAMTSYEVNEDNFPVISLDFINSITKSKNIVSYTMSVDLATKEGTRII